MKTLAKKSARKNKSKKNPLNKSDLKTIKETESVIKEVNEVQEVISETLFIRDGLLIDNLNSTIISIPNFSRKRTLFAF
jgi:hypothetical protein